MSNMKAVIEWNEYLPLDESGLKVFAEKLYLATADLCHPQGIKEADISVYLEQNGGDRSVQLEFDDMKDKLKGSKR